MSVLAVVSQMIVLAFGVVLGFVARKIGIMTDAFDGSLTRLVLDVTLPCMILSSILCATAAPERSIVLEILGLSFVVYGLVIIVAIIVPLLIRAPKSERGAYSFMVTFSNVGFMGFPVLEVVFGSEAVLYGAIFNITFHIFVFTVGVLFVSGDQRPLQEKLLGSLNRLASPAVITSGLVMCLALIGVHDVPIIGEASKAMGNMTTPAAMLLIGSSLAKYAPREMVSNWRAFLVSAIRLLVVPALLLVVCRPFVPHSIVLGVMVVIMAMPVATNGLMLSLRYGGNLKVMTQGIFISTIASIVTIPLVAMLVSMM